MSKVYTITDHEDGTLSSDGDAMVWLREQIDHACKPYKDALKIIATDHSMSRVECAVFAAETIADE